MNPQPYQPYPANPQPYPGSSDPYRVSQEPPLTSDETSMAMLAHLLAIVGGGFIGPLVILVVKGGESRFVKFHALTALFMSLGAMAGLMVSMFGGMAMMVALTPHGPGAPKGAQPPLAMFAFIPILGLFMLTYFLTTIVLCIRAKEGKWSAVPGIGRLARRMAGVSA